ncbi:hypothetical protein Bbelb_048740 [Branchiostoma belcheri]|nr:hypothetical protein Bbelb_048740 [Branchiostoma belcheri]
MVLSGDKHTRRDWLHSRAAEIVDLVSAEAIRIGKGMRDVRVYARPKARVTHELKKHNLVVNETVESSSDTSKEDYVFNYHNAKLGMSQLLTNIQDVTKEGDGERVARYFRMANSLLWDRFVNTRGGRENIAGDLRLEHMNNLLKSFLKRRKRRQYKWLHQQHFILVDKHDVPYINWYGKAVREEETKLWTAELSISNSAVCSFINEYQPFFTCTGTDTWKDRGQRYTETLAPFTAASRTGSPTATWGTLQSATDTVYEKYRSSLSAQMYQPIQNSTFLTMWRENGYNKDRTIKVGLEQPKHIKLGLE